MSTERHLAMNTPPIGRQEEWQDSAEGYPQTPPYDWWIWHDDHAEEVDRSRLEMVHQGRD